jgi:hypothetical protein
VFPIAGQKFPPHFKGCLEIFCGISKMLFTYSTISRGTPDNVPRKPGWETLIYSMESRSDVPHPACKNPAAKGDSHVNKLLFKATNCVPDSWWSTTCLVKSSLNIHLLLCSVTQSRKVDEQLHVKRTLGELAEGQPHYMIPIHLNFSVKTFGFFAICTVQLMLQDGPFWTLNMSLRSNCHPSHFPRSL